MNLLKGAAAQAGKAKVAATTVVDTAIEEKENFEKQIKKVNNNVTYT